MEKKGVVPPSVGMTGRAGMTPQAVARLFMIALIVFGPYLGSVFAFEWAAPASAASVPTKEPANLDIQPISTTDSRISVPRRVGPTPTAGLCGSATNYANNPPDPTTNPLKGVQGTIYARGDAGANGGYSQSPVTITVFKSNSSYDYLDKVVTNDNTGHYGFGPGANGASSGPESPGLPSNQSMIIQFDAGFNKGRAAETQLSYFDYFRSGDGGNEMGRYSQQSATRIFLDNNCKAYAIVEKGTLPSGYTGVSLSGVADAPDPSVYIGIPMTNPSDKLLGTNRFYDGVVNPGRSIGGRIFGDNGTDSPTPYVRQFGAGQIVPNIAIYPFANGTADLNNPTAQVNADPEGYYDLAGTGTNLISANQSGTYILQFKSATTGSIATSYYCNYLYGANRIDAGLGFDSTKLVQINLTATGPQNVPITSVDNSTDHNKIYGGYGTNGRPPCASTDSNNPLSLAGLNEVLRGNIQITGTISLKGGVDPTGAYAVALDKNTGQVVGSSNTVGSDGNYLIDSLQANVQYYVKFFPPLARPQFLPQYYQNVAVDKTNYTAVGPISPLFGQSIKPNINATLDTGYAFTGVVTLLNNTGPTVQTNVSVLVYKTSDLQNNPNPQPVTVASTNPADGTYTTDTVMIPGVSYTLSFVPQDVTQIYKSAWCNLSGSTCTAVPNAAGANGTLINSDVTNHNLTANITLAKGVVVHGTISGHDGASQPIALTSTTVKIFVYQVTATGNPNSPIAPTLAQFFGVSSSGNTLAYNTAALEPSTGYIVQAVPTSSTDVTGFRPGYYCGTCKTPGNLTSSAFATTSAVSVSSPNVPSDITGVDIGLFQASGISVTLYTYLYNPITNTNAYYPGVRVSVYGDNQVLSTTTTPLSTGLTDSNGQVKINGLGVQSPGGGDYRIYFQPTGSRGLAAFDGSINCTSTAVAVTPTAGQYINVVCIMPPFSGVAGAINTNPVDTNVDWTQATLNIFNQSGQLLANVPNNTANQQTQNQSNPLVIELNSSNSKWDWSLYYPSGKYKFQIVPGATDRRNYLPHWVVSDIGNGANANDALTLNLTPEFPINNADVNFRPGGVLVVKVVDPNNVPIPNAQVLFYDGTGGNCTYSGTPLQSNVTAANGVGYSLPSPRALCVKAIGPASGPSYGADIAPSTNVTDTNGVVQFVNVTLVLRPTPFLTGYVKVHNQGSAEQPLANVTVQAVNPTDGSPLGSPYVTTTTASGFYTLPIPTQPFKLQFSPSGYETRYWLKTPLQNGTPSLGQGDTIVRVTGQTYNNYNQVYDNAVSAGCAVTDQYVVGTSYDGTNYFATVGFNTSCPGDSQVGYSSAMQTPILTNYTVVSNTAETVVYTHKVTQIGPLTPGNNYYLRTFSKVTAPDNSTSVIAGREELRLSLPNNTPVVNDGKNWFFAQGEVNPDPTAGISETLHLFNYTGTAASVTINYYKPDGTPVTPVTLSLPANSRKDVVVSDPNDVNSLAKSGYTGAHSTWVVATGSSIVVERSQSRAGLIAGSPYRGAYTTLGAAAPGGDWYFPDISTKPTTEQIVSIFNPNTGPACVSLQYYRKGSGGGLYLDPHYTQLPAKTRVDINVNSSIHAPLVGTDSAPGETDFGLKVSSVIDTADGCNGIPSTTAGLPIVAEEQTRYVEATPTYNYRGVAGMMGAPGDDLNWYFLDGQSDKATDVQYVLINAGGAANVTITFQIENPVSGTISVISQVSLAVPSQQRVNYSVPAALLNRAAPGTRLGFTAKIESDRRIVVQRSVKFVYNPATSQSGLYHEMGTNRASTQWLFAAGDTLSDNTGQNFTDELLNLYNPSPVSNGVRVTYYYSGGSSSPTNYTLSAYGRASIQPSAPANTAGYPSVGLNKVIAIKVESDQGIFAERLTYWRKPGQSGGSANYGWNAPGF